MNNKKKTPKSDEKINSVMLLRYLEDKKYTRKKPTSHHTCLDKGIEAEVRFDKIYY